MKHFLKIKDLSIIKGGEKVLEDINLEIRPNECVAFVGASGSGKTTLLRAIRNYKAHPKQIVFGQDESPVVKMVGHQHHFKNLAGINNFYYQQRFNSQGSADSVTVWEELSSSGADADEIEKWMDVLNIAGLQGRPLIQLSNGEHKRTQIAKALIEKADWLLLDHPYTGLDVTGVKLLDNVLEDVRRRNIEIVIAATETLPAFVTKIYQLKDGRINEVFTREEFLQRKESAHCSASFDVAGLLDRAPSNHFDYAVRMRDVVIRYGNKTILDHINWEVKRGSKWCLSGPNGSGKSTLLSLITGDNPQAYANDIHLFDRKRGTGETIWEIKKKIGFVSPEMHYHYNKSTSCFNVVASGLFDTIGLFRKITQSQRALVNEFMERFELSSYSCKPLGSLPQGRQRLVLLARALVKNPPLLILDEPCQGLDEVLSRRFTAVVDEICSHSARTLIYVSHIAEEIPYCVNNFLRLNEGRATGVES